MNRAAAARRARGRRRNGAGATPAGDGEVTRPGGTSDFLRSLLREGLFPAMRVDPVVLRAFLRMFNLLEPPDSLMADADVIGRVMAVYQDKDNRPPEPRPGARPRRAPGCL